MRRLTSLLVVSVFAGFVISPASGAESSRDVTKEYRISNGAIVLSSAEAHWTIGTAYHVFRPQPGERFISFSITDDSGMPARGHIHIDANRDGDLDSVEDFCSETPEPIAIGNAKKIEVGVIFGTCPDQSPAIVTTGTVTATFSK